MQTLNQRYAIIAFERVQAASEKQSKEYKQKYGTMAHKLPILIRSAGLVQALTFVFAKGARNDAWQQYLTDIAQTLEYPDSNALLKAARTAPIHDYIFLTNNVLSVLLWYKRFAEGILKVEPSDDPGSDS